MFRTGMFVALVVSFVFAAAPALATTPNPESAHYPVVQFNHRGNDAKALQYLLKGWGYSPGTIDGVFGTNTKTQVELWQTSKGLTSDGYMVDADWVQMLPYLSQGRPGMIGDHIRALQLQLNAKDDAGLAVDGSFGSGTKAAVQAFQTHRGISADGVVGPTTWKHLLWHFELMPDTSTTCDTDSSESEEWGHSATVGALLKAAYYLDGLPNMGDLPYWDLSTEHSGISTHLTHQRGMDVDIGIIGTNNAHCSSRLGNYDNSGTPYSYIGTSYLVTSLKYGADFAHDGMMQKILFNDPDVQDDHPGLVIYYSGHSNHLHVRYCSRSEGSGEHNSAEETKWTGGNCI